MLIVAFAIFVVLLFRLGNFNEYLGYREVRLLERHVMQAYDDAVWEDRMTDFRVSHPRLQNRSYISFGRRR
jgi:hypothetical protein